MLEVSPEIEACVVSLYSFIVVYLSLMVNMFPSMLKKEILCGCCLESHIKFGIFCIGLLFCARLEELFCSLALGLTAIHNLILKGPWSNSKETSRRDLCFNLVNKVQLNMKEAYMKSLSHSLRCSLSYNLCR